ncbi:hypothetical protein V9T40_013023 [Parthenolecanium corni]|uniref:guanylate cyclase n=1 Tax=Parthenolecanium corni TaxID=536013 RepID=A0AAN9XZW3_9HEMI
MVYCAESDSLMFLGTPALDGLESLTSRCLFISDIPLHDATRDVILVGEQARAQVSEANFTYGFDNVINSLIMMINDFELDVCRQRINF